MCCERKESKGKKTESRVLLYPVLPFGEAACLISVFKMRKLRV